MFKFNGLSKLEKVSTNASRAETSELKNGAVYYLCCTTFILSAQVEVDKMQSTQTTVINGWKIYYLHEKFRLPSSENFAY